MSDYENHKYNFNLAITRGQAEQLLKKLESCKEDGEVKSVTMKIDPEVADMGVTQLKSQLESFGSEK